MNILRILLLLIITTPSLAHERHVFSIDGNEYLFVIGSLNEPLIVGDKSGVDFKVKELATEKPVEGLEQSLKVEIKAKGTAKILNLKPAYKQPGTYHSIFYPTTSAQYQYRVFGTFKSTPLDLTFSCSFDKHAHDLSDTKSLKISDKVTRVQKKGAFGCPLDKVAFNFP